MPIALSSPILSDTASAAPSWLTLLHAITSPTSAVSVTQFDRWISACKPALIELLSSFTPATSGQTLAVKLAPEYLSLVQSFSSEWNVSLQLAYKCIERVISMHVRDKSLQPNIDMNQLIAEYHKERAANISCLIALLRVQLEADHPYHQSAVQFIQEWIKSDGEKKLMNSLEKHRTTDIPQSIARSSDRSHATVFADNCLYEQALMMEALFFVHYESDLANSSTSSGERLLNVWSSLSKSKLNQAQPLFPYLSDVGRGHAEWLICLSTLLIIAQMMLGEMALTLDHPLFDLLDESKLAEYASMEQTARDNHLNRVRTMVAEIHHKCESHPLFDAVFLKSVDQQFFAPQSSNNQISNYQMWDSDTWTTQPIHAPILLAYNTFIAMWIEIRNNINQVCSIYQIDSPAADNNGSDELFTNQTLIDRVRHTLELSPFQQLGSVLDHAQSHTSLLAADEPDPNLPGYKEIISELITSISVTTLYSMFVSVGMQFELSTLLSRTYDGSNALCFRFWEQQDLISTTQPMLEETLAVFPMRVQPLLELLSSLCGVVEPRPVSVMSNGLPVDNDTSSERDEADRRDAESCTRRVFDQLSQLNTYAMPLPSSDQALPFTMLSSSRDVVVATETFRTEHNVLIPAGSYGRVLPHALVWNVRWSAWAVLADQADRFVTQGQSTLLSSDDWTSLTLILGVIARIIHNDPSVLAELQANIAQSSNVDVNQSINQLINPNFTDDVVLANAAASEPVDLTALALRCLILLVQQSQFNIQSSEQTQNRMSLSASLLSHACDILTAMAQFDLFYLTRTLVFLFSDSITASMMLFPMSIDAQSSGGQTAAIASHAFTRCVHRLHSGIETTFGSYPLSTLTLTLLQQWIPHQQLGLLQQTRGRGTGRFPTVMTNAEHATAHSLYGSLELSPLLRYSLLEQLASSERLKFIVPSHRWLFASEMARVTLLALNHSLSIAVENVSAEHSNNSIRSVIFDWFASQPALVSALVQPILVGCTLADKLKERRQLVELEALQRSTLHSVYAVQALHSIERSRLESGASNQAIINDILMTIAIQSSRANTPSLLAAFRTSSTQPRSFVHALVSLISPSFPPTLQSEAIRMLTSLATPLPVQSQSQLFSHLSVIADELMRSLVSILTHKRHGTGKRHAQVWKFLSILITHSRAIADLLLKQHNNSSDESKETKDEQKGEIKSTRKVTDLHSAILSRVDALNTIISSSPVEAVALSELLLSLWATPSISLNSSMLNSLRQSTSFWKAINQEFDAQLQEPALGRHSQLVLEDDRMEEVDEQAVRVFAARLSIRAAFVQITVLEFCSSDKPLDLVKAAMASCFKENGNGLQLLSGLIETASAHQSIKRLASDLSVNVDMCRSPLSNDEGTNDFMIEIPARMLHDDLLAVIDRTINQSTASHVSQSSTQIKSTALVTIPSIEQQRAANSRFLLTLSRVNLESLVSSKWFTLIRSLRFALQLALDRQPMSFTGSLNAFSLVHALSQHLSNQPDLHVGGISRVLELASMLQSISHFHLSNHSSNMKPFGLAVLTHIDKDGVVHDRVQSINLINESIISLVRSLIAPLIRVLPLASSAVSLDLEDVLNKLGEQVGLVSAMSWSFRSSLSMSKSSSVSQNEVQQAEATIVTLTATIMLHLKYSVYLQDCARLLDNTVSDVPSQAKPKASRALAFARGAPALSTVREVDSTALVLSESSPAKQNSHALSVVLRSLAIIMLSLSTRPSMNVVALNFASFINQAIDATATIMNSGVVIDADPAILMTTERVLPTSLQTLASSSTDASHALSIIQWLSSLSRTTQGARLLVNHSLILHLAHHHAFRVASESSSNSMDDSDSPTSVCAFPTYLNDERNSWHIVWCRSLALINLLCAQLIGQGQNPSSDEPVIMQLLELYAVHRARCHLIVGRTQLNTLSLAGIEELEAITSFLNALTRVVLRSRSISLARLNKRDLGELLEELMAQALVLTDETVRLLIDSRQLEARAIAVSQSERILYEQQTRIQEKQETVKDDNKNKVGDGTVVPVVPHSEKKKVWRKLGENREPESPAPLARQSSQNSLAVPSSPAVSSMSFLLRSPVVNPAQHQSQDITTESILDASTASSQLQSSVDAGKHGRAFFVQLIEFGLCKSLSHALEIVREARVCQERFGMLLPARAQRSIFGYRIRIIHVTSLVGGALAPISDHATHSSSSTNFDAGTGDYDDLFAEDEEYDFYSGNSTQSRRMIENNRPRPIGQPTGPVRALPDTPNMPPLAFQPQLSVVADLVSYNVNVLARLLSINPLLREAQTNSLNTPNLSRTASAYFSVNQTNLPRAPSLVEIQALTSFNLEQAMLLLCDQSRVHVLNLITAMQQLGINQQDLRQQKKPTPTPTHVLLNPTPAPEPIATQTPARVVAHMRIVKTLDHYKDRLTTIIDETQRLITARAGQLERRRSGLSPMPQSPSSAGPTSDVKAVPASSSLAFVAEARAALQELVRHIESVQPVQIS